MAGLNAPDARLIRARVGFTGAILAGTLVLVAIAIVAFLATQAEPALRGSIHPSWIEAPRSTERALVRLDTEGRP